MLCIPARDNRPTAVPAPPPAPVRPPGVLIADDLALILAMLKVELEGLGFAVWTASSGEETVDRFRRSGPQIDLVLLDARMPGLDAPGTLAALQALDPGVRCCFMTGDPGPQAGDDLLGRGALQVFRKPFRAADVARAVRELVSAGTAAACPAAGLTPVVQGTLQRIDYYRRRLTVVAGRRQQSFKVAPGCAFWLDGRPVEFRCFHPLDRVAVAYGAGNRALAIFGRDPYAPAGE
jgi:CheY-like chemotaxis protein